MPPIIATLWASIKAAKMAITLAVIAVLVLLNIWQAVNTYANLRWDGPFGIGIGFEGWKPKAERLAREHDQFVKDVEAAQEQARAAQIAVNQAEQARLDAITKEADHAHETTRVVVRDATDRFIADRMQDRQCVASGTDSAASGDGAGVPESLPADPIVAVNASDVRACSEWVAYGLTAREWALGLAGE